MPTAASANLTSQQRGECAAADGARAARSHGKTLLRMVLIALAIRLAVAYFLYPDYLRTGRGHWAFGNEAGQIATSLYEGRGFGSPFFAPTGPSALLPPAYPYMMLACMKLFGGYTPASAMAILSLNCLFASLTVIPVFFIARRIFDLKVSICAAWAWVFFPYSIVLSGGSMWVHTMACFTACLILLQTLRVAESSRVRDWVLWGALWGVAALASTALLGTLPFFGIWAILQRRRAGARWIAPVFASALVFILLVAPWSIRNYRTFHRFIPVRDGFWLEVHRGNSGDTSGMQPDSTAPPHSEREYAQWVSLGETGYLEAKKAESKAYIRAHPVDFVWVTLRRFAQTWTGFWSLNRQYAEDEPFQIPNVFFTTCMTALMLMGLRYAAQAGWRPELTVFVLALIAHPLVYYVTHPSVEYRHPLDPIIVILVCYGIIEKWRRVGDTLAVERNLGLGGA